jgi:hypothetical protein
MKTQGILLRLKAFVETGGVAIVAVCAGVAVGSCRRSAEPFKVAGRPDIVVLDPALTPLVVGQPALVTVTLSNTGKTPAVDVQSGTRLQIGDMPLVPDTAYPPSGNSPITVGSNMRATITLRSDHPVTQDEFNGLVEGSKQLKAHGEITFTSNPKPSEPLQHVHFCFESDPSVQGMVRCETMGNRKD